MNWDIQGKWDHFVTGAKRILTVSRKPDTPQYMSMTRITAIGIIVLGVIGFLVELVSFLIKSFL